MRGKLNRPDPAHHERGNGEEADFRQNHQADRNTKPHHLAQRLPVRPPEAGKQAIGRQDRHALDIDDRSHEAEQVHASRHIGRRMHAEGRHAEMPQHEGIGKDSVEHEDRNRHIKDDGPRA